MRVALIALAGCGFSTSVPATGGDGALIDARELDGALLQMVSHVAAADATPGTGALTLGGAVVIDTTSRTISTFSTLPTGVTFDPVAQDGGVLPLAVLRVTSLDVVAGANVTVVGDRALVVIASGDVTITGTLDAGARLAIPGAGGAPQSSNRQGQGGAGQNDGGAGGSGGVGDSGGGGAGFASAGARGGGGGGPITDPKITIAGPMGGALYGTDDLARLVGGAAGGVGSPCMTDPGGAGGGAIQITAFGTLRVPGTIHAGGGGGGRGYLCAGTGGSGGGAGSGGAIFLEASKVFVIGTLAANGGSGGSGSDSPNGLSGLFGNDATAGAMAAPGALQVNGGIGGAGGAGGWRDAAPVQGADTDYANGGGGGGSVGRIVVRAGTPPAITGVSSPMPFTATF